MYYHPERNICMNKPQLRHFYGCEVDEQQLTDSGFYPCEHTLENDDPLLEFVEPAGYSVSGDVAVLLYAPKTGVTLTEVQEASLQAVLFIPV